MSEQHPEIHTKFKKCHEAFGKKFSEKNEKSTTGLGILQNLMQLPHSTSEKNTARKPIVIY